jgi:hypothetical protein
MIRVQVDIVSFKEHAKPYIFFDLLPRVGEHVRIPVTALTPESLEESEQRTFVVKAILHTPPTEAFGDQHTTVLFVDEVSPNDNPFGPTKSADA